MTSKVSAHLHKRPPNPRNQQRHLYAHLRATRIDDNIQGLRAPFLHAELLLQERARTLAVLHLRLARLKGRREERLRRRVLEREVDARGHDVDGDDA